MVRGRPSPPGANGPGFSLLPRPLSNGAHTISAVVRDNTPRVRNDPDILLTQTVAWNIDVNIPSLTLDAPTRLADGRLAFRLTGNAPQGFVIQSSTNLVDRTPLTTNTLTSGQFWFTSLETVTAPAVFYRAKTPP